MKTPFTTEQFFQVFEKYNTSVFPLQVIILLVGLLMLWVIIAGKKGKNTTIAVALSFLWIWMGAVYHVGFFASLNPPAYAFGGLFILQGIFLLIEKFGRKNLEFAYQGSLKDYAALFFIAFGLFLYPAIGYLLTENIRHIISFGLPCPTTIVTFGFLMLADKKLPKYLLIIPVLWAVIATGAALNFGVYQDFMLIATAIVATAFILRAGSKKRKAQIA